MKTGRRFAFSRSAAVRDGALRAIDEGLWEGFGHSSFEIQSTLALLPIDSARLSRSSAPLRGSMKHEDETFP